MHYNHEATTLAIVLLNILEVAFVHSQSSNLGNVTKKAYKPVKEYTGKYWLDDLKDVAIFPHKHVEVKRAVRVKRAMKRKNKDSQDITKKKPPRTTRVKTSKVWIIKTTSTTTPKPRKYNDSLKKCQRRKLMNIAVGNDKLKLEDILDHPNDRKLFHEIWKPWNVIGEKSPTRRIRKRLNRINKLNYSTVLISTHLGYNYTMSLLQFKKQRPSYLVNWNVSHFQIYNTSVDTKGLHQGRLSLAETALNPNLTVFDLWWNDTLRNLDTQIRTISLNRSKVYRIKYPRRQDRGHRPTYGEKKAARLSLLKYYIGTTPGEIIPTRYYNKALLKDRQTPIKRLSKKIMSQQKKDRLKRINKERRRRRILKRMGFKVTNIPTPSSTSKITKIRRQDPILKANLSFFDRDPDDHAFMDISAMLGSEFEKEYEIVTKTTRLGLHRKQKTSATTAFYDEMSPTQPPKTSTTRRSKQKLGLEKKLMRERGGESK